MASVHDVAKYILQRLAPDPAGPRVTAWKLQKLVYYAQAWSLVWDEKPLFPEPIQAWADGPVCPDLYRQHKGRMNLFEADIEGDPSNLTDDEVDTIDAVLAHYGQRTGRYLSDLTHMERPWREARGDTPSGARSQTVIDHQVMVDYYGGL